MCTLNTQSPDLESLKQGKNKDFKTQLQNVFISFFESPKTMKEVDAETTIMRESICRYVRTLRLEKRIAILRKRKCTITGDCFVNEYTTNPDLFPPSNQLQLF